MNKILFYFYYRVATAVRGPVIILRDKCSKIMLSLKMNLCNDLKQPCKKGGCFCFAWYYYNTIIENIIFHIRFIM